MSHTVHLIHGIQNFAPSSDLLPTDHTGENLAKTLTTTLDSWRQKEEQHICITKDTGVNIVSATNKLG